jgi:hypothetical protein
MEAHQEFEPKLEPYGLSTPAWDEHLAWVVSKLCSPPLVAAAGIIISATHTGTSAAWGWAGFYILLAVSAPVGYVLWLVRQGKVTDFDLRQREQRTWPYLITLVSVFLAWLTLHLGGAPQLLMSLALAGWFQVALLFVITLYWKISVHSAAIAGLVVFIYALFGPVTLPLALLIPLVAWSRLRLKRHTLPQTLAGTIMGCGVMALTLYLTW